MAWNLADLQKLRWQANRLQTCDCCAVLMLREVAGEEEPGADRQGGALAGAPEYAVQLAAHRAALHPAELQELQRVLDAQRTRLPKELFDSSNAELLRYAATHGLLEVREPVPGRPASAASVSALQHCVQPPQRLSPTVYVLTVVHPSTPGAAYVSAENGQAVKFGLAEGCMNQSSASRSLSAGGQPRAESCGHRVCSAGHSGNAAVAPEAQVPVATAAQYLGELGKHTQTTHSLSHDLIPKYLHSAPRLLCAPPQMSTSCCDV